MTDQDTRKQLAALFQETGAAHHRAYIQTDGEDPDWPLWYAEHIHDQVNTLLFLRNLYSNGRLGGSERDPD